ncbi:MAG: adenosine kinase [Bacteroidales bacterium]|nr:adenosine kinase [Bacteroidales bacterium]
MKSVLGIGNALVDILVRVENEEMLKKFKLPKGSMQLVSHELANEVDLATSGLAKSQASGGSASNTMHGLAKLGIPAGYIGKIGHDHLGEFFKNDLLKNNIQAHLLEGSKGTGRALTLITTDTERTFATHLGSAIELQKEELIKEIFEKYSLIHIEGYLLQNHSLLQKIAELAKATGAEISLDLASYNIVEENLDFLNDFIQANVDIVFANEEEAKAYGKGNTEEGFYHLGKQTSIAVVKTGRNGSVIHSNGELYEIGSIPAEVIDTTGAGDLYASGFLYGYLNNYSLKKCGDIGSLLAAMVIELVGAKIDEHRWTEIKTMLKHL